jgi:hypothetical protein
VDAHEVMNGRIENRTYDRRRSLTVSVRRGEGREAADADVSVPFEIMNNVAHPGSSGP